jgi:hypothetical protein
MGALLLYFVGPLSGSQEADGGVHSDSYRYVGHFAGICGQEEQLHHRLGCSEISSNAMVYGRAT